jgi:hypothetical protein
MTLPRLVVIRTLAFVIALVFSASTSYSLPLTTRKKVDQNTLPSRKLTTSQNQLIDKAIVREKEVVKTVKERAPLVETYIQNMRPDRQLGQVPASDQHFLGRVEFGKIIGAESYAVNKATSQGTNANGKLGFLHPSVAFIAGLGTSLHLNFTEGGFVQMLLVDSNDFDRQHYSFGFVRNEFLGTISTEVFTVKPASGARSRGRFFGYIWVETRGGNIVRFNGTFAGSEKDVREFYDFDSWRTNVQPNLWLPTSFYLEENDQKSVMRTLKFKAINHIWGYVLKVPQKETESTSLDVVGATDVSNEAPDVMPLGAQRAWIQQAEDNVVERLFQAGLLDAPSEFDKTLEALAANILAYNNITLTRPIHCRTLLTEPLESIAVGNTIILSKSLIDTTGIVSQDGTQQLGNLNALLAFQIAHIILGHRLDTTFAFSDSLLFPNISVFNRIPMRHTDADNVAAAKKAIELLSVKELEGGQQYFGLYLQQLQQRVKSLKALNEPVIGDGLVKSDVDQTFWLAAMMDKSPKLDMNDLKQEAAMPLSSFLRRDPWTDQVITMHAAYEPLLSPADKMPFEVEPVHIKLSYDRRTDGPSAQSANGASVPADPLSVSHQ